MKSYNEILDTFEQDMKDHIDPINDYSYRPTIRHGIFSAGELEGHLPAVCFECYKENFSEALGTKIMAEITIKIYGFIKNDGLRNTNSVRKLAHDVVYFLYSSDNTYVEDTWIDSDIEYWESGTETRSISSFIFDIRIKNDVTYNTLRN